MNSLERDAVRTVGFLLDRREARCNGVLARNRAGDSLNPGDERACAWCLWGAILIVASRLHVDKDRLYRLVSRVTGIKSGLTTLYSHLYEAWDHMSEAQADAYVRQLQQAA